MLRAVDDDEAEDTEMLTLTATSPDKVLVDELEIELVDNDTVTYALSEPADTKDGDGNYLATYQALQNCKKRAAPGRSWQLHIRSDVSRSGTATTSTPCPVGRCGEVLPVGSM